MLYNLFCSTADSRSVCQPLSSSPSQTRSASVSSCEGLARAVVDAGAEIHCGHARSAGSKDLRYTPVELLQLFVPRFQRGALGVLRITASS